MINNSIKEFEKIAPTIIFSPQKMNL